MFLWLQSIFYEVQNFTLPNLPPFYDIQNFILNYALNYFFNINDFIADIILNYMDNPFFFFFGLFFLLTSFLSLLALSYLGLYGAFILNFISLTLF